MIDEVFKTATNDAKGEDEIKRLSRKLGLSEFESVVDFRTRNASSSFMNSSCPSLVAVVVVTIAFFVHGCEKALFAFSFLLSHLPFSCCFLLVVSPEANLVRVRVVASTANNPF